MIGGRTRVAIAGSQVARLPADVRASHGIVVVDQKRSYRVARTAKSGNASPTDLETALRIATQGNAATFQLRADEIGKVCCRWWDGARIPGIDDFPTDRSTLCGKLLPSPTPMLRRQIPMGLLVLGMLPIDSVDTLLGRLLLAGQLLAE